VSDSRRAEILDCHQRPQIRANAGKRIQQPEAAIPLISLGKVRERFAALGTTSIRNRLLYQLSYLGFPFDCNIGAKELLNEALYHEKS
jgi:hypothetical protein